MSREFLLVVDDDEEMRDSMEDVLALAGYHVVAVENGEQAIGALAVATPRAVLTDLSMPMRNGYSLIEHIRRHERTQSIPVCVVSADSHSAPHGALAIPKPFDLSQLLEAVRRVVRRAD